MDEVDSIGSARIDSSGGSGDSEVQRTMLELLNQLDGFEATNKIKVGAAGVGGAVLLVFVCLFGRGGMPAGAAQRVAWICHQQEQSNQPVAGWPPTGITTATRRPQAAHCQGHSLPPFAYCHLPFHRC